MSSWLERSDSMPIICNLLRSFIWFRVISGLLIIKSAMAGSLKHGKDVAVAVRRTMFEILKN
jgi:hypothetical protein